MSAIGFRLRVRAADGTDRSVDFVRNSLTIGSGEDAGVQVPDATVSELHLRLRLKDGQILATDLNTETGTQVEGRNVAKDTLIGLGQVLQLGGTRITVEANDDAASTPTARTSTDGNAARVLAPEVAAPVPKRARIARHASDPRLKELAARFLSDELPESLRPTEESKRLQVALIWGRDQFLDLKELAPGQVLTVGDSPDATFNVHHPSFPGAIPFVQPEGSGFRVLLRANAPARIDTKGTQLNLDDLVSTGQARRLDVPLKGTSLRLGLDDRVTVDVNDLRIIARYTKPQGVARRPLRERLDLQFLSTLAIVLLVAGALERMVAITDFTGWETDGDILKQKELEHGFLVRAQPKAKDHLQGTKSGAPAPKPPGRIGTNDARVARAEPPRAGGNVIDKTVRETNTQVVQHSGLLDAFAHDQAAMAATLGVGGSELDRGLRGIDNNHVLEAGAGPGLTVQEGDRGGGGKTLGFGFDHHGDGHRQGQGPDAYRIGIGSDPKPGSHVPRGHIVDPQGGLTADEIGGVVKRHWNEIRYCYEKELNHSRGLEGKVALHWEIGPVGDVTVSQVRETDLGNAGAEDCMVAAVRRWKFPTPRGGGVVEVNYPFIFEQQ